MAPLDELHIKRTTCFLCRQPPGPKVLDSNLRPLSAPQCDRARCMLCYGSPLRPVWLHAACYEILAATYEPSAKPTSEELTRFADAMKPLYDLRRDDRGERASALEGLFSEHSSEIMQDIFSQDLLRRLPAEMRVMISDLVPPCWYLIVLGETRRLLQRFRETYRSQPIHLNLSKEAWILETSYRGSSYVSQISAEPLESTTTTALRHIKLPDTIDKILLSVDGIGIRAIRFLDNKSSPQVDGSPWYKIIDGGYMPAIATNVTLDGIFVRDLQLAEGSSSKSRIMWSSPVQPKFHPWNFHNHKDTHRLHYQPLDANIKGLLVCCAGSRMFGIHASSDTPGALEKFIAEMSRRVTELYKHWVYFPLNSREKVTGAWIRKFELPIGSAADPALILHTSRGRTVTFGPQYTGNVLPLCEYRPLMKAGDGPVTGIFHDGFDPASRSKCVAELGVTCALPVTDETESPLEVPPDIHIEPPPVPPGQGGPTCTWYLSKVPLKGLLHVQLCRDTEQQHRPILGVLLSFNDGHQEALGQFRWDLNVDEHVPVPLYFQEGTIGKLDYIKDIKNKVSDGSDVGNSTWQRLPDAGSTVASGRGDTVEAFGVDHVASASSNTTQDRPSSPPSLPKASWGFQDRAFHEPAFDDVAANGWGSEDQLPNQESFATTVDGSFWDSTVEEEPDGRAVQAVSRTQPRFISITQNSNLHLRVDECERRNNRGRKQSNQASNMITFEVEREKLMASTFLGKLIAKNPRRTSIDYDGANHAAMEILLKQLHGCLEPATMGSVPIDTIWHLIGLCGRKKLDVSLAVLKDWFVGWYQVEFTQAGSERLYFFQQVISPCYQFNYAEGFMEASKFLVYMGPGAISELNPINVNLLQLRPLIIQQLNSARGRLRNVLHHGLFDHVATLLDEQCKCREKTFFEYFRELRRIQVWPLESYIKKTSIDELIGRLASFRGNAVHPMNCCPHCWTRTRKGNGAPRGRESWCRCRRNWKKIVRSAEEEVRGYFDGLCLDCMLESNDLQEGVDKDAQYYQKDKKKAWSSTCRVAHDEPTWYFSFMERRECRR
ncbi:uncharacterized protein DSM5745_00058 [Aspergillus mulundensis]|uniref:Uncharacterized protein n=1 Tax=Aspergillus mulundensis TaxID=1810919 RepID=A0A3D8T2E6_9EURO|nr:hypothetical protein DSM5745_00058 [Aspergillus mulundensis]RDW92736.1 hypothetical protein DSM5745_00058 [Aspergillus mulundensis]